MTTFISREEWGAKPRKAGTTSIVDHPSTTFHYVGGGWEYPWNHSSCDDKVRGIQIDHMTPEAQGGRGWSDIAYNYLVCPHDCVYEGRGYDRRSSANGYEAANNASFAVCALWGTASADDPLPDGLKNAYLYARQILMSKGGATTVVKGHRDWKSTDCPGDQIYAWIQAGHPAPDKPPTGDNDMTTDASVRAIVNEVIKTQAETEGQPLHELVQNMAIANNEYVRQMKDDFGDYAAKATDLAVKDDFVGLQNQLNSLQANVAQMSSTMQAILNKLNNPPA
jgi:hypothetical protein